MHNSIYIVESSVKCPHNAKRYINFIKSRIELNKTRDLTNVITEKHHIIPSSMGGSNKKDNLVRLTLREHFIAHLMLYEIYKSQGMANAIFKMSGRNKSNSWLYKKNKTNYINSVSGKNHPGYGKCRSEETKKRICEALTGKIFTEERKINISKSLAGENHPMHGKFLSAEQKQKISDSNKGQKRSEETKLKISELKKGKPCFNGGYWTGKKLSKEHVNKVANSNRGKKRSQESKNKMSESTKKLYYINGIIYLGREEASMKTGLSINTIKYRCGSKDIRFKEYYVKTT